MLAEGAVAVADAKAVDGFGAGDAPLPQVIEGFLTALEGAVVVVHDLTDEGLVIGVGAEERGIGHGVFPRLSRRLRGGFINKIGFTDEADARPAQRPAARPAAQRPEGHAPVLAVTVSVG